MVLQVIRGNKLEENHVGAKITPQEFTQVAVQRTYEVQLITNPKYEECYAQDQMLLGCIYNTIELTVVFELMGHDTS